MAFEVYNKSDAAFELFLQATSYLANMRILDLNFTNCDSLKKNPTLREKMKEFRTDFGEDPASLFKNAIKLDCEAAKKNDFLLFRGTGGFKVNSDLSPIIDSPYRESAEDYAQAEKEWPLAVKRNFLTLKIDNAPHDLKKFQPKSLSYGNSLLSGIFS